MFARVAQDDGDRHAAEITVLREALGRHDLGGQQQGALPARSDEAVM